METNYILNFLSTGVGGVWRGGSKNLGDFWKDPWLLHVQAPAALE